MSQLLQLRSAIVTAVATLTGWTDVKGHYGRFTEQQLREFLVSAPACRVAVLALDKPIEVSDDGVDYEAQIGIYLATKDTTQVGNRDEIGISAMEAILVLCDRNRWGLGSFCKAAHIAGARNLYSEKGMNDGVALWAIDLRQPMRIADPDPVATPLTGAFYGISPNIGPANISDYTQVPEPAA